MEDKGIKELATMDWVLAANELLAEGWVLLDFRYDEELGGYMFLLGLPK